MKVGQSLTKYLVGAAVLVGAASGPERLERAGESAATVRVVPNDNTRAAGRRESNAVVIRLRASEGAWQPEGPTGPVLNVEAFGEVDGPLMVPAPLVRVREGDAITLSLRNDLSTALRVHGLCARDGGACSTIEIPAGSTRETHFASGRAGTYHYWATTLGAPVPFRELAGAFVVDPAHGEPTDDRIFVITEWSNLTAADLQAIFSADEPTAAFVALHPKITFVINGLSWPATERLTYRQGQDVRWRIVNLSSQTHPMHLHGFYFSVTHVGDGRLDGPAADGPGLRVVTHAVPSGGTMAMRWTPEREGRWLFHCHVMHHLSPERRLSAPPKGGHGAGEHSSHGHDAHSDASLGMAGMALGITVEASLNAVLGPAGADPVREPRQLVMEIQPQVSGADGTSTAVAIRDADGVNAGPPTSPGPVLVLERDRPAAITVVNRLAEPTSIHWHGLELDSYYDGVHGWSGVRTRVAPMIDPGESLTVRITPPRAGTFIYHTHLHDYRQLTSGLYGALVVTDPGEQWDPSLDHVVVLARRDATETTSTLQEPASVVINGERSPRLIWRAGAPNRIRLINITPDDVFDVSLMARGIPVTWRPVTKDGAPVDGMLATPRPATRRIAVGETYDFEFDAPAGRQALWLEVRTTAGKWQAQGQVVVR